MLFLGTDKAILDILEEHLDTLRMLWGRRCAAWRDSEESLPRLLDLEERIVAHTDGLVLAGDAALPLLRHALAQKKQAVVLAAAFALLSMERPGPTRLVLDAFCKPWESSPEGLRRALCYGPITPLLPDLQALLTGRPDLVTSAAAEVLAFHGRLDAPTGSLAPRLRHPSAEIRLGAWRTAAEAGGVSAAEYQAGLEDADPAVRCEALRAAAWGRQPWLLDHCRRRSVTPSPDQFDTGLLLAILGQPSDLRHVLAVGENAALGPRRFQVLSAFGHPGVVPVLLHGLESKDFHTAVAAGAAFTRILGVEIESDQRTMLPPEDGHEPDEFEKHFLDEVILPSPQRALAHWERAGAAVVKGVRWCRGLEVSRGLTSPILTRIDLESRWHLCLRDRFEGRWHGRPADLEAFPQQTPVGDVPAARRG